MDRFKVSNVEGRSCDISFNGEEYRVAYDSYMGDYRFYKGGRELQGPYGRYYYGDEAVNGSFFTTKAFKEGFITERTYEQFKKYNFRLLYGCRGNEYITADGIFKKGIRNCECAFYHDGRYRYLAIGEDGYPTVEKSFSSLAEIRNFVDRMKQGSRGSAASGSKHVNKTAAGPDRKTIIAGALAVGGLAIAGKLLDKLRK